MNSAPVDEANPYGPQFQLRVVFWLLVVHWVLSWFLAQYKQVKQLKNERTEVELQHLKSQINPHFLFNTLNNLYGLALEKSDETPGVILKLSDMLRYTIYQSQKDRVSLSDEVNYLNDFIQLQQLRYNKAVNIEFVHSAVGEARISPLMLIIMLENAYKHGVEKLTDEAFVAIRLTADSHQLVFDIKNNYDPQEGVAPGIGLKNLRRRLALVYPERYQLSITDQDNLYHVKLTIELD
jgi:LytS/YehU family sensor histidine kinase